MCVLILFLGRCRIHSLLSAAGRGRPLAARLRCPTHAPAPALQRPPRQRVVCRQLRGGPRGRGAGVRRAQRRPLHAAAPAAPGPDGGRRVGAVPGGRRRLAVLPPHLHGPIPDAAGAWALRRLAWREGGRNGQPASRPGWAASAGHPPTAHAAAATASCTLPRPPGPPAAHGLRLAPVLHRGGLLCVAAGVQGRLACQRCSCGSGGRLAGDGGTVGGPAAYGASCRCCALRCS